MMKDLNCDMCGLGLTIITVVDVLVFSVFGINMTIRTKNNSRIFKVAVDFGVYCKYMSRGTKAYQAR